jgi:uncharacterized protein (DUF3820 family)
VDVDPRVLVELANTRMPFGRYQGRRLLELPEGYLVWFQQKGWPVGKLGGQLAAILEIKHNGLAHMLAPLVEGR